MDSVQRYKAVESESSVAYVWRDPDGKYVLHADYLAIAARLAAAEAERDVLKECNENQAQGFKQISDAIGCDDTMETGTIDRLVNLVTALAALRERVRGVRYVEGECIEAGSDPETGDVRIIVSCSVDAIRSGPAMVYRPVRIMLAADVDAAVGSPAPVEDGDGR